MFANLPGKVALITGSTSGIGLSVAKKLASQGVHIGLNGFAKPEEVTAIRKEIEGQFKVKTFYHGADLKEGPQVKSMVQETSKALGSVDILVNNAGIQYIESAVNFPEQKFNDIIAINLTAAFLTTKYALPQMLDKNWGRIINIASVHGLVASVNKCAYVAAKHGIVGLTKATALEVAKTGVTINAVCPGWVMTKLIETQIQQRADQYKISFEEAQIKLLEEKQPSVTPVQTEQLGDLITFLCSNSASQIKGSTYTMDGGWTAQ
ncbi:unnamed protein product [Paramecium octaurelia]|uniref:3-hydroxybutyrate dehydrogenase n=1 Tax=Paramecium octaurelia TaxID=43137 RepID=A0A8S1UDM2_PAROT|nr:unnamed protein product [Paramecium octaurelia]